MCTVVLYIIMQCILNKNLDCKTVFSVIHLACPNDHIIYHLVSATLICVQMFSVGTVQI